MSKELHVGASNHRLFAEWQTYITEPIHVWTQEWQTLAARAISLVCNDPFAAAMVNAKIRETHGPKGMSLRSAYSEKGGTQTSASERDARRAIEAEIRRADYNHSLDAGRMLTRLEIEKQLDWIATVMGDAWAVYCWKPGRRGATVSGCWRIVSPDRVNNPEGKPDTGTLRQGVKYDSSGEILSIFVQVGEVGPFGYIENPKWQEFPIYNETTGMRQVIHRKGYSLPGSPRGFSMFAPALLVMRQIQGLKEAHVAGKRAQAVTPIIYFTDEEKELADAVKAKAKLGPNAVLGPMSILVAKYGNTDVKFMDPRFNGADMKEYLITMYADLSAMWGLPWQVVRCEMGDASLSSARAGLDQCDRTCETYGLEGEQQASRPIDEAIIRESVAMGRLSFKASEWSEIMDGRYSRPPKYSTDRQKDANTIATLITKARVSPTDAHSMFGLSYEDQAEQTARDIEFAQGQGLPDPTVDSSKQTTAPEPEPANDGGETGTGSTVETEPAPTEKPAQGSSLVRRFLNTIRGKT